MDVNTNEMFTPQEIFTILQNTLKPAIMPDIESISHKIYPGSSDLVGFMGEYYKLEIHFTDEGSEQRLLNYFIKSVPRTNAHHRDECERKGFFAKETSIYSKILPNIQKFASSKKLVANCYYTRPDLMVLEDLNDGSYCQTSPNQEYTEEHQRIVLKHLANLHAASIAWELSDNFKIGNRFKDDLIELQITMSNEWYVTSIHGIHFLAKQHPDLQDEQSQRFIDNELIKILSSAETLIQPNPKEQNVLCHRDTWDRNIFFHVDESKRPLECAIVDFQLANYNSPTMDVNFFLSVTTSRSRLAQIYDKFLEYYFAEFQAELDRLQISKKIIPKEQFLRDNKRSRLAAMILLAICEPLMKLPNDIKKQIIKEDPAIFDFYMNNKRDGLFTRVMNLDASYSDIIMPPIKDLIQYMLENRDVFEGIL